MCLQLLEINMRKPEASHRESPHFDEALAFWKPQTSGTCSELHYKVMWTVDGSGRSARILMVS